MRTDSWEFKDLEWYNKCDTKWKKNLSLSSSRNLIVTAIFIVNYPFLASINLLFLNLSSNHQKWHVLGALILNSPLFFSPKFTPILGMDFAKSSSIPPNAQLQSPYHDHPTIEPIPWSWNGCRCLFCDVSQLGGTTPSAKEKHSPLIYCP